MFQYMVQMCVCDPHQIIGVDSKLCYYRDWCEWGCGHVQVLVELPKAMLPIQWIDPTADFEDPCGHLYAS